MGDTKKPQKTRSPGVYKTTEGLFQIRWTLQVQARRQDREETLAAGTSLEGAIVERANRIAVARTSGSQTAPARPPTLADYAASWLERKKPSMKLRSQESYAQILDDWVLPFIGHIRIDDLRRSHLESWLAFVEEWGYRRRRARPLRPYEPIWWVLSSRETLKGWWNKLKQLLRDACAEHRLPDLTERMQGPKAYGRPPVQEQRTLTFVELLTVLAELEMDWRVEVFTDMESGMRPGELYELRWDVDVDFARDMIDISRSHSKGVVGTTKTNKVKSFPMTPLLKCVLQTHRRRQIQAQGAALATGLVFPATEAGKTGWHRRASSLRNKLARAGARCGIEVKVTPQVLRRTYNTLQKNRGVDKLALQDLMGHSSDQMTDRYYASTDDVRRAAVEGFERELGALRLVSGE